MNKIGSKKTGDDFTSRDGVGNITAVGTKKATIFIRKGMKGVILLQYKCLMHPHLVRDVQFWSPHLQKDTVALRKGS